MKRPITFRPFVYLSPLDEFGDDTIKRLRAIAEAHPDAETRARARALADSVALGKSQEIFRRIRETSRAVTRLGLSQDRGAADMIRAMLEAIRDDVAAFVRRVRMNYRINRSITELGVDFPKATVRRG